MATPESLTQKWLRQNVHSYPQKDRVYADVDSALVRFPTLRPKSDVYTYDDGRTQLLLCVHGLLPISFRQASYNIPVAVWVTREYPRQPPIGYVVPTGDMLVKAGKYIDVSGRCNVAYMQHWEKKSEGCNLSALLEAMQDQFSSEPPVYSKPKNVVLVDSRSPQSVNHGYAGKPPPPFPANQPAPYTLPASPANADRPILPPKPGSTGHVLASQTNEPLRPNMHASPPLVQSPVNAPPLLSGPPQYFRPLAPPTYQSSSRNSLSSTTIPPSNRWATPSRSGPHSPSPTTITLPVPQHSSPYHSPTLSPPPISRLQNSPAVPPPPTLHPVTSPTTSPPTIPPPNFLDGSSDAQYISTSHLSTSSAPPPRPPNPELLRLHADVHGKLTSELASLSHALTLDAARLRAHQADLLAGEPAIRDETSRLEAVRDVCRNVAGRIRNMADEAERNVAELRRKGDPEVDELVCSTTIVHNQLINLVAEDNSIEDTIYHLHRALNSGRIDLERFLRTTRVLAEEQFMKRALVERIHNGLPMGSMGTGWS